MGHDKALLPFGNEVMMQRVVRLIEKVVSRNNIVVVAAADQALPTLPAGLQVARDSVAFQGPLAGMATGLRAYSSNAVDALFVTACDAPFLQPRFVERMFDLLGHHEAAVPVDQARYYPLAAVYRPVVLSRIESCLECGQHRVRDLIDAIDVQRVSMEELRTIDAELRSLVNVNSEEEYHAALVNAKIREDLF